MSLYQFGKVVVRLFFRILFRLEIEGLQNIPKNSHFIICCNHKSYLDPPLLGLSMPFELRYMAKEELFHNKLFGKLITALGAFPIKRGQSDVGALRTALKLVKSGAYVVVFPEGGRSHDGYMRKGKMGAVMIAVKASANILPVGIEGTYRPFSKLTVHIGQPIDLSMYWKEKLTSGQLQELTDQKLMPAISTLAKVKTYENRNS